MIATPKPSMQQQGGLAVSPGLMATAVSSGRWWMPTHLELIDRTIRDIVLRRIPERVLVIRMPPRHGKSSLVSHYAPAWFLANFPEHNCLLTSYEADFAASWGKKARDTFVEVVADHPQLFRHKLSPDRQSASDWGTTAGGYMATAGVGGPLTGKGFHFGVADDLIKNPEQAHSETYRRKTWEWFTSTLWSRREPSGVLVVIGTPWHRDDYLARLRNWDEPIKEICLPATCEGPDDPLGRQPGEALWPERFSAIELGKIERAQGAYYWRALYQQEPSQHDSAEWPEGFFDGVTVDRRPEPDEIEFSVMTTDPSIGKTEKSDYSAHVMVDATHDGKMVASCDIRRRDLVSLVDDGLAHCDRFQPVVWALETNGFASLDELIKARAGARTIPMASIWQHKNKLARIRLGVGPALEQRRLQFVASKSTEIMLEQLRDFPLGKHDDGPDALEMAIRVVQSVLAGEHIEDLEPARVYA